MKILITAGGTKEKIDDVRYIANHSTGQLGATIADTFAKNDYQVTYIHGYGAKIPSNPTIRTIEIFSTQDLATALEKELTQHKYQAVIHSMAVSDYTMANAFSQEELLNELVQKLASNNTKLTTEQLEKTINDSLALLGTNVTEKKLSSNNEHLILRLKKNPKIISTIKALQPQTILIGFKLLVDVSEEQLIQVAQTLLEKNKCDYVLANDLTTLSGNQHRGLLVGPNDFLKISPTKQAIADMIVSVIKNRKDDL